MGALQLTERNLSSLIAAKHHDAVLMTDWREAVRDALATECGDGCTGCKACRAESGAEQEVSA
jgi:hypothetical protein